MSLDELTRLSLGMSRFHPSAAGAAARTGNDKLADEVSIKDFPGVVGDGVVPWTQILGALAATGYDGPLSLEYEYRWHREDLPEPLEGFRRSAEHLTAILAAVVVAP